MYRNIKIQRVDIEKGKLNVLMGLIFVRELFLTDL
jgi:hypothetical protein